MGSSLQQSSIQPQHNVPHQTYFTINELSSIAQSHDDRDEESSHDDNAHRRHVHLSQRIQEASSTKSHGTHNIHSPTISHHNRLPVTVPSKRILRLIFMRHSERADQALGYDWFSKAFRTNTYRLYDQNLPIVLPKRDFNQAYEYDVPLTGLQINFFSICCI